jgi:pyrimidine deaminase RibD-like protein/RNA-binding protein YhbY
MHIVNRCCRQTRRSTPAIKDPQEQQEGLRQLIMRRQERLQLSMILFGCMLSCAMISSIRAFSFTTAKVSMVQRVRLESATRGYGRFETQHCRLGPSNDWKHHRIGVSPFKLSCRLRTDRFSTSADVEGAIQDDNHKDNMAANDILYMEQAIEHARNGLGHTYPNPAVGCVIVARRYDSVEGVASREEVDEVLGRGFHPRAGFPHAEVFALLQAFHHVEDGVAAARSIAQRQRGDNDGGVNGRRRRERKNSAEDDDDNSRLAAIVTELTAQYVQGGAQALFTNRSPIGRGKADEGDGIGQTMTTVTAYVTLEPCCHEGKATPPCAAALVTAGIDRVVIGFRDPNPRVDGGGVRYLQERGVAVEFTTDATVARDCQHLVADFCKRITPPFPSYEHVTGAMRSALRTLAAQKKQDKSLAEVSWGGETIRLADAIDDEAVMCERVNAIALEPEWIEHLDGLLWRQEIVLMRLNQAVAKKRYVKQLGDRIALQVEAHVAQTSGHTVLLYRPGKPPVLDLETIVATGRHQV